MEKPQQSLGQLLATEVTTIVDGGALWGNCGGKSLQTDSAWISTTISAAFNSRLIPEQAIIQF